MSSSPAGSPTSSDAEDVSTCDSSSEESPGTTGELASSSDDDHEPTPVKQPTQGRKHVRRSQNWLKNVRKRRRNAGKRYMSDTTKKMVSLYLSRGIKLRVGVGVTSGSRVTRVLLDCVICLPLGNAKAPHKNLLSLCQTLF